MYSPLNRLLNTTVSDRTSSSGIYKKTHWLLNLFEFLAFLSFLPGMFLYLFLFVISGINLAVCIEIERGGYLLPAIIIFLIDIVPSIVLIVWMLNSQFELAIFWYVLLYGSLGILGLLSIFIQKRFVAKLAETE